MLTITPIPAFADNYIWCLQDGNEAVVVDPGDAAPTLQYLRASGLHLRAVLVTHHHPDHVGGLAELTQTYPGLPVYGPHHPYGPSKPRIAGITQPLREGDRINLFGLDFAVLEVPGHTLDHIAYVATANVPPLLFCGDTLFAAGCGRLFEGTAAQMWQSLQKFAALPAETRVYCTHEYTLSNLKFAHAVEPANAEVTARLQRVTEQRAAGIITLPSTIGLELATNPFLRSGTESVRQTALTREPEAGSDPEIFAAIRRWKDQF